MDKEKQILAFLIITSIALLLQFVLFIPFFFIWRKDCKEIGKENLAVSLRERFLSWCICFPLWIIPIVILKENSNG